MFSIFNSTFSISRKIGYEIGVSKSIGCRKEVSELFLKCAMSKQNDK